METVDAQRATAPNERIVELDSLRGVAALMVVCFHYTTRFDARFGSGHESVVSVPWGRYGVDLFFVVSGYVITSSVTRSPKPSGFAINRVARLYPAYVVAVLVSAVTITVFSLGVAAPTVPEVLVNLTMFQAFFGVSHIDGVYWTLAVELVFYAMVLVALWTGGWARPIRDWAMFGWSAVALAWVVRDRLDGFHPGFGTVTAILYFSPMFIAGIAIREGAGTGRSTQIPFGLTLASAALTFALATRTTELIIGIVSVAAVWSAVRLRPRVLRFAPLVAVGEASYVLYLMHQLPGYVALRFLDRHVPATVAVLVTVAVAVGLSVVIHRTYEVAAIGWTRRQLMRLRSTVSARR